MNTRPSTSTGMNEIACTTMAAATAWSFGAPKNVGHAEAIRRVIAADAPGCRDRHAHDQERCSRNVPVNGMAIPNARVTAQVSAAITSHNGKRPEQREQKSARLPRHRESATERVRQLAETKRNAPRQHAIRGADEPPIRSGWVASTHMMPRSATDTSAANGRRHLDRGQQRAAAMLTVSAKPQT